MQPDLIFPNSILQRIGDKWLFASVFKYERGGQCWYKGVVIAHPDLAGLYIDLSTRFQSTLGLGSEAHALQLTDTQIGDLLGRNVADTLNVRSKHSRLLAGTPALPDEVLTPAVLDEIEIPETGRFLSYHVAKKSKNPFLTIEGDLAIPRSLALEGSKIPTLREIQRDLPEGTALYVFEPKRGLHKAATSLYESFPLPCKVAIFVSNAEEVAFQQGTTWWVPVIPTRMWADNFPVFDHMISHPDCPRNFEGGEWLISNDCLIWTPIAGRLPDWQPSKIIKFMRYS